jgi:hypothetical protein
MTPMRANVMKPLLLQYEKDNHYMNSFTYTEAKDVRFEVESLIWFQNRRVILNYMLRRYE